MTDPLAAVEKALGDALEMMRRAADQFRFDGDERLALSLNSEVRNTKAALASLRSLRETHQLVPKYALDWLDGRGPDQDGVWFGDEPNIDIAPRFWWRNKFARLLSAAAKE